MSERSSDTAFVSTAKRIECWYGPDLRQEEAAPNEIAEQLLNRVHDALDDLTEERGQDPREELFRILGQEEVLHIACELVGKQYPESVHFHPFLMEQIEQFLDHGEDTISDLRAEAPGSGLAECRLSLLKEQRKDLTKLKDRGHDPPVKPERKSSGKQKQDEPAPIDLEKESISVGPLMQAEASAILEGLANLRQRDLLMGEVVDVLLFGQERKTLLAGLSPKHLRHIAAKALTELASPPRTSRAEAQRFSDVQSAVEAVRDFRDRVTGFITLPGFAAPDKKTLEKLHRDLSREFKTLLVRLAGLTTETIKEKRAIVKEVNWSKRKLKLRLVWSDNEECSLAVDTSVPEGYWRVTRNRGSLTERTAFPPFSAKPKNRD